MQYPGNRSRKVYSNIRANQEFEILELFEAKLQKVCVNYIFEIFEDLRFSFLSPYPLNPQSPEFPDPFSLSVPPASQVPSSTQFTCP